ncbi:cytochrome C biogenesis protein [Clostridium botulinum A2 117]|uniref:divalent cation tolerance protein CutA n=1 Tax=Clostridium botulinum TaxID=1491 RepID=UPI0007DF18B3|nr:divalent cation tolerance protein CutA [Clostridium botulinum]KEI78558.1 cytochrome C biogenesis protein [Clostridium botulinum A2 117]MBN3415765.1 cytochrome C biogenesis protein [Clostridium botulinum]MBN3442057.1 cytochrome C biogenesis protein [Clostridium botulinum]MBY6806108.1 divalent cation tolerance protein CutA [Clostridium botulinum]NFS07442.1 divalent cation tolerance protein CutA [Clostridium botulinum]
MEFEFFKIETFIPEEYVKKLREALNHIGALTVGGNYDNCMTISRVKGSWRPLVGSTPFNGDIGEICEAEECKVEFCCTKKVLKNTITTIKKVHPYEIPVINIIPILNSFEF